MNDKPTHYVTLDSGKRQEYDSGMIRDLQDDKPRYDLIPMAFTRRLADLYMRGAIKYGDSNWMLANSEEELARFKQSALRHMYQWLEGDTTEDHSTAVAWNIAAAQYLEEKLHGKA